MTEHHLSSISSYKRLECSSLTHRRRRAARRCHLRRAACRPAAPCRRFSARRRGLAARRRRRAAPVANVVPPVASVMPPLANVMPSTAVVVPLPLLCRPSLCRPSPCRPSPLSCHPLPSSQQRAPSPIASVAPSLVRRRRGAMVCVNFFAIGGDRWDAVLILRIPT